MKILLCGAGGQIGSHIADRASRYDIEVRATNRRTLDICQPDAVQSEVRSVRPDVVVNAAAFTDVDRAERAPAEAFAANAEAPGRLADACAARDVPLVHLSTDYVFDGRLSRPYREDDPPRPLSVYGWSKWKGEVAIREGLTRHLILRTSWVFSDRGRNFARAILRQATRSVRLPVVDDQTGGPTAAADIADVVLQLALRANSQCPWGTFHFCGTPATTWYGLGGVLLDAARRTGHPVRCSLVPVSSAAWSAAAPRPPYSVLDCQRIAETFGISCPPWRTAVESVVRRICAE